MRETLAFSTLWLKSYIPSHVAWSSRTLIYVVGIGPGTMVVQLVRPQSWYLYIPHPWSLLGLPFWNVAPWSTIGWSHMIWYLLQPVWRISPQLRSNGMGQMWIQPQDTSFSRETSCPSIWSHCTACGNCCAVDLSAIENQEVTFLSDGNKSIQLDPQISGNRRCG